ncbi:MAG TPA: hypothetical protein DEP51_02760 [Clostridiales bacterium]|nr:hypothetical protein [Clostridiales bacterium]
MLSGDNGILQKATTAKTETEKGQEQEIVALAYNSALAKKVSSGDSTAVTAGDLNTELASQGAIADENNPIIVTFTGSKRQYTINNGMVEYAGIQTEEHGENDWIVAWTYNGTTWSEPVPPGATLSGNIIAKVYKNNTTVMVMGDSPLDKIEVEAYSLQITGNGNMGDLCNADGNEFYAWQDYYEDDIWLPNRITEVSISANITSIGNDAFNSFSLTNFNIPNKINSIGNTAFYGSTLTSITIPNSVRTIGENAFCDSSLNDVYYIGSANDWNNITIDNTYNGNDQLLNASIHYSVQE